MEYYDHDLFHKEVLKAKSDYFKNKKAIPTKISVHKKTQHKIKHNINYYIQDGIEMFAGLEVRINNVIKVNEFSIK